MDARTAPGVESPHGPRPLGVGPDWLVHPLDGFPCLGEPLVKGSADASAFREYYSNVSAKVRKEIYEEILSCEVNGDPDAFERLAVRILAYTASGRLYPAQAKACHDILALISHSIVARKVQTTSLTITAEVKRTLQQGERLKNAVTKKLPDYGSLTEFLGDQAEGEAQPVVIDAEDVPRKPTVRLTRG